MREMEMENKPDIVETIRRDEVLAGGISEGENGNKKKR
jgi:hypothetical protein